jgi:hypothetical protein
VATGDRGGVDTGDKAASRRINENSTRCVYSKQSLAS